MKAGLNGNFHPEQVSDLEGALKILGVRYLGEGEWQLPKGAVMADLGGNDWLLTLANGKEFHVWTEN